MNCQFYDKVGCLQNNQEVETCGGQPAFCPRRGTYMRRPGEIRAEMQALDGISETDDANLQPALIRQALAWVLGLERVGAPSGWFK